MQVFVGIATACLLGGCGGEPSDRTPDAADPEALACSAGDPLELGPGRVVAATQTIDQFGILVENAGELTLHRVEAGGRPAGSRQLPAVGPGATLVSITGGFAIGGGEALLAVSTTGAITGPVDLPTTGSVARLMGMTSAADGTLALLLWDAELEGGLSPSGPELLALYTPALAALAAPVEVLPPMTTPFTALGFTANDQQVALTRASSPIATNALRITEVDRGGALLRERDLPMASGTTFGNERFAGGVVAWWRSDFDGSSTNRLDQIQLTALDQLAPVQLVQTAEVLGPSLARGDVGHVVTFLADGAAHLAIVDVPSTSLRSGPIGGLPVGPNTELPYLMTRVGSTALAVAWDDWTPARGHQAVFAFVTCR